jgi:stage II sporulation protein R
MKKIFLIILVILTLLVISKNNYNLTKDAIRFRVIANSNSAKDILMKEKIVNSLSNILFKDQNNKEDTKNYIINNISNVEKIIDNLFEGNNYDMKYNINYGLNYFPEKVYNGIKFDEGNYESLVIEIGNAKGNNYWCILYPPLCMIDDNFDNEKVKYKFKVVELLKNLF